jgi:cytochrome b involved in lipid metabolism
MRFIKAIIAISIFNFVAIGTFLFIADNIHQPVLNNAAPMIREEEQTLASAPALNTPKTQINFPEEVSLQPITKANPKTCVITIEGNRYNVFTFKNQHSGGDIFQCGTDMTSSFFGQHEQQLLSSPQMQALRLP